jgi:hypothetical protein
LRTNKYSRKLRGSVLRSSCFTIRTPR